jgi:hypothetical protein
MHEYCVHMVNNTSKLVKADDVVISLNVVFFKNSETELQKMFSLYNITYWEATDV